MPPDGKRVLVTGGTGFVGSHVVDVLLEAGYGVRCTVRATSNLRWLERKPVELVEVDLQEGGGIGEAVAGMDAVIHCAGLTRGSPEELFAANQQATRALLDACVGSAGGPVRFVFCSSQAAAGPSAIDRPREVEDRASPSSDYGRSKLAAERDVLERADRLEVTVLRPVAVYGPRDADTLPYFKMANGGVFVIPGLRHRLLQLVHARDVATAMLAGVERREAVGQTFFVAHPELLSWKRLAEAISKAVGRRTVKLRVPSAIMQAAGATAELLGGSMRAGQLDRRRARDMSERAWTCNVDRTFELLGWSPEFDVKRGLQETAEWYRKVGWL
jgi:dihydroflavonol-4-reductase